MEEIDFFAESGTWKAMSVSIQLLAGREVMPDYVYDRILLHTRSITPAHVKCSAARRLVHILVLTASMIYCLQSQVLLWSRSWEFGSCFLWDWDLPWSHCAAEFRDLVWELSTPCRKTQKPVTVHPLRALIRASTRPRSLTLCLEILKSLKSDLHHMHYQRELHLERVYYRQGEHCRQREYCD